MIQAELEFNNNDSRLSIRCSEAEPDDYREVNENDKKRFIQWIESYRHALKTGSHNLLPIGRDIYQWLNGSESWLDKLFDCDAESPFILEFTVPARPKPDELCFLEVPWELLADKNGYLAAEPLIIYCPVRRIGKRAKPKEPSTYCLNTVFMAAAPHDNISLHYEEEETAILDATGTLGMDLVVEESGNPVLLAECMAREKPVDVLHISCHGTLETETKRPILLLETEVGASCHTTAHELDKTVRGKKPRLLFLSACMTSEPDPHSNSFSTSMIRHGVPAVLGWGGSVRDTEATFFASALYKYLSQFHHLEEAVAWSRLDLLDTYKKYPHDSGFSGYTGARDWHMARLYLGRSGGGSLSNNETVRKPMTTDPGEKFLYAKDGKIPVAGRREFVGRRRHIQKILWEFKTCDHAGVLIHGIGRQGKSSLAARIAHRLTTHQVVVIYKYYDALAILEAIESFAGTRRISDLLSIHKEEVRGNPANLLYVLKEILEGPCRELVKDDTSTVVCQPILLVIDDFEQTLEAPGPDRVHRVKSYLTDSIRSVIAAFAGSTGKTLSRLLITSRYRFTLPFKGRDFASELLHVHLPPMKEFESRKQATAKEKVTSAYGKIEQTRSERCIRAAHGNPGLQDLLLSLCLESPEMCDDALASVEEYIAKGRTPRGGKVLDFIENLAVQPLVDLLSHGEKELLRASTLFRVPVPVETMELIHGAIGVKNETTFGDRLLNFGLWEPSTDMVNPEKTAVGVDGLARPLAGKLSAKESSYMAKMVVCDLLERWGGEDSEKRPYAADIELTRLALEAEDAAVLAAAAKDAVRGLEKRFQYEEAAHLGKKAIKILKQTNPDKVSARLLRAVGEVLEITGDMKNALVYISEALKSLTENNEGETEFYAYTLVTYARMLARIESPSKALPLFEEAKGILKADRFARERSIILGDIARLKARIGELKDALKLHYEVLKVYEELGDIRSQAVARREIARVKAKLGDVDEALTLHREQVKVFKELGDRRSRVIVCRDIARILADKGDVDDAMKCFREQLTVFAELGDLRETAITKGDIAHILSGRGDVDKAIKLHEEGLNVYEELKDKRAQAITKGYIARIMVKKGELDEAMKLHQEELQLYEDLKDKGSRASAFIDIARIHAKRGELTEALELFREQFDFFKEIGLRRSQAVACREIARILFKQGEPDEALYRHREQLKVFEGLGDRRETAITKGDIARILVEKKDVDGAVKLQLEKLKVCEEIKDSESKAITLCDLGKIELKRNNLKMAFKYLDESYAIFCELNFPENIGRAGKHLGKLLCLSGEKDKGLNMLERSRDGLKKLGLEKRAAVVQVLIEDLCSEKKGGDFGMNENSFKLCFEGEGAGERAKELADFIEKELGQRPHWRSQEPSEQQEGKKSVVVDPMAAAAVILAIPAAVLACVDLVDRIRKKEKLDCLIKIAKNKQDSTTITITSPKGAAVQLHMADSGEILDAANEIAPLSKKSIEK